LPSGESLLETALTTSPLELIGKAARHYTGDLLFPIERRERYREFQDSMARDMAAAQGVSDAVPRAPEPAPRRWAAAAGRGPEHCPRATLPQAAAVMSAGHVTRGIT